MGIAKSIMGFGEYSFYNYDYKDFIKKLAGLLKVNLDVYFANAEQFYIRVPKAKIFDFGYTETYSMRIDFFSYVKKSALRGDLYFVYDVNIPVKFPYEEKIDLEFQPNGIFMMSFLTFEHLWKPFIEALAADGWGEPPEDIFARYEKTRMEYINVLRKIGCDKILIYTDAHYKFEDEILYNQKQGKKYSFEEVVNLAVSIDNMKQYRFKDLLKGRTHKDYPINFRSDNAIEIVIVDDFSDEVG